MLRLDAHNVSSPAAAVLPVLVELLLVSDDRTGPFQWDPSNGNPLRLLLGLS